MAEWTEAEDKMLAYLTKAGISARQIATQRAAPSAPSSMPLKPPRDSRAGAIVNVIKLRKLREEMEASTKAQPKKLKHRPSDGEPAPLLLDLEDLTDATCKWPVTDGSPFKFCGHKKDTSVPYCPYHQRAAHPEVTLRKSRKIARAA